MAQVIITPHISSKSTAGNADRLVGIFVDNVVNRELG